MATRFTVTRFLMFGWDHVDDLGEAIVAQAKTAFMVTFPQCDLLACFGFRLYVRTDSKRCPVNRIYIVAEYNKFPISINAHS